MNECSLAEPSEHPAAMPSTPVAFKAPTTRRRTHIKINGHAGAKISRWIERDAVIVTDISGSITEVSPAAAAMLGQAPDALLGNALKSIIPGLPFAPETPGYNLAYTGLYAIEDLWLRRSAQSADGQEMPIEVALASASMNDNRYIVLTLRHIEPETLDPARISEAA